MNKFILEELDICLREHSIQLGFSISGGLIMILKPRTINHLILMNWNTRYNHNQECIILL